MSFELYAESPVTIFIAIVIFAFTLTMLGIYFFIDRILGACADDHEEIHRESRERSPR